MFGKRLIAEVAGEVLCGANTICQKALMADSWRRQKPGVETVIQLFSRYPVLKIHQTRPMHIDRKTKIIARLIPTLTSALS